MRLRTLNGAVLALALGALPLVGTGTASARDDADEKKAKQKKAKQEEQRQKDQEQRAKDQQRDQYREKERQQKDLETQQWDGERQVKQQQTRGYEAKERLSKDRQQMLIEEHRGRVTQYGLRLYDQERLGRQREEQLRREKRHANYRYQQHYLERLREQRLYLDRAYDYDDDPYFYTPPTYRYWRGGRYYEVNDYAVDMLRKAVKYGYTEGVLVGQADREDGWRRDYRGSWAYEDANYGYTGYYVGQSEYNDYFREGFRRGYSDAFSGRYEYGSSANDAFDIRDDELSLIIRLEPLR